MPIPSQTGTQTGGPGLSFGLDGISDTSPAQPFLDVFKTARAWVGHLPDRWGGVDMEAMQTAGILDADGYPTALPTGVTHLETFLLTELPAAATYAAGRYRLTYEGTGDLRVSGSVQNAVIADGEIRFDHIPDGTGMVSISIFSTDPAGTGDHLRDFVMVKEDNIPAYEAGEIFNPLWLEVLDGAHAVRFMDWMQTNNSDLQSWADRPLLSDRTRSGGVPVKIIIALANRLGTDAWFNIPHNADDDFIRRFAETVRDGLDPGLRAHFEFSNEVWNFLFEQAHDSTADADARFGGSVATGWMQEYGARASEMAMILDAVFAGQEHRLVKTIATHTGWPGLEDAALDAPDYVALGPGNAPPYTHFDTYAITSYFGYELGTSKADTVLSWIADSRAAAEASADAAGLSGAARAAYMADHRFDMAVDLAVRELRDGSVTGDRSGSLAELFETFAYHARIAREHGLDLVTYEGGTHVVAGGAHLGHAELSAFFTHLNYSDGMGQLYAELLEGWVNAGGMLFNAFVEVARPGPWGSWGNLRHLLDDTARDDALDAFLETYPRLDRGGVIVDPPPDPVGALILGTAEADFIGFDTPGRTADGDTIQAGAGDDRLFDGAGGDVLDGGKGFDVLSLWEDGDTLDIVVEFDPGEDMLDLSPQGVSATSQLIFAQREDTADLMIDFAGDRVILRGMWDIETGTHRMTGESIWLAQPPPGADPAPPPSPYLGPDLDLSMTGPAWSHAAGEAGLLSGGAGNDRLRLPDGARGTAGGGCPMARAARQAAATIG